MTEPWLPAYPIRTDRLVLRPHRADDLDDLVRFHSDTEVTRYIPWPARDRAQTELALTTKLSQGAVRAEGGWLVLAIVRQSDDRVIGEVLLKREDDAARIGELGYVIASDTQGSGFASEAARAMLELGFGELGLETVIAHVDARNAASIRLLEGLGFTRDSTHDAAGVDGYSLGHA